MSPSAIDIQPLRRALAMLDEALTFWQAQADGTPQKPHLRSAVVQSFELSYELALRSLRRVLIERAGSAQPVVDLLFELPSGLSWDQPAQLRDRFEASELPFRVDLSDLADLPPGMRERVLAERLPL